MVYAPLGSSQIACGFSQGGTSLEISLRPPATYRLTKWISFSRYNRRPWRLYKSRRAGCYAVSVKCGLVFDYPQHYNPDNFLRYGAFGVCAASVTAHIRLRSTCACVGATVGVVYPVNSHCPAARNEQDAESNGPRALPIGVSCSGYW